MKYLDAHKVKALHAWKNAKIKTIPALYTQLALLCLSIFAVICIFQIINTLTLILIGFSLITLVWVGIRVFLMAHDVFSLINNGVETLSANFNLKLKRDSLAQLLLGVSCVLTPLFGIFFLMIEQVNKIGILEVVLCVSSLGLVVWYIFRLITIRYLEITLMK